MHVLYGCKGLAQLSPSPGNQLHGIYYYYSINGNNILHIRCEGEASTQQFLLFNFK
jgi:hypothetical protein